MASEFGVPYLGSLPVDPLLSQVRHRLIVLLENFEKHPNKQLISFWFSSKKWIDSPISDRCRLGDIGLLDY